MKKHNKIERQSQMALPFFLVPSVILNIICDAPMLDS